MKIPDHNALFVSANEIMPGLWLGNQAASQSKKFMIKNNVRVIVNCTKHLPDKFAGCGIKYYRIAVNDPGPAWMQRSDTDVQYMYKTLPIIIKIVRQHLLRGDNVLIHCHAGMQRSAAVVLAYMCKYYYRDYNRAKKHILKCRPIAFNFGTSVNFALALHAYCKN